MRTEVTGEMGVFGLRRVEPGEAGALRGFLERHWPATVKFLGQLDEEGGDFGWWWADRWPRPGAVLCRGRRSSARASFSLFAADDGPAERILDGIDWSGEVGLSALAPRFLPLVRRRAGTVSAHPCGMFRVEREGFRPFRPPDGRAWRVEPLRKEDAPLVARHWAYGEEEGYPLSRILAGPTTCVRVEGRPVS
ncbi:MAG: hypothetical protein ACE5IM_05580, partial [Nitrospinota bacterium]